MSCVCPSPLRLALAMFCSVVAVLVCLPAVVRSLTQVIERATAAVMIIDGGVFNLEMNQTEIHQTISALTASYSMAWTV